MKNKVITLAGSSVSSTIR